ncbi:MAG: type III pantothenate kinase [Acidobacteriota bacterium]
MLLAVDIGNTNIKFGVFDGEKLSSKLSIPTIREISVDVLTKVVSDRLPTPITAAIVCSVVPEVDDVVADFLRQTTNSEPVFVTNNFDFGLKINYEPPSAAGTDRLVNSFAASQKYGIPCVVCSFGTATTIDIINAERTLLGGLIAPGFATMARALALNTSKLPEVEFQKPGGVIGRTTIDAIRSGIFFSQIGLLESSISRIADELGETPTVVATGGFAAAVAEYTGVIDKLDESLTLGGLRMLYSRHKG